MTTTLAGNRLTFGGAVRSEFLKLSTVRRLRWVVISAVLVGAVAGTTQGSAPEPGAEAAWTAATIAGVMVAPWIIVAIYAALQATGEWSSGQFRVSFATVPRRTLWLAAKACAVAVVAAVVAVLVLAVSAGLVLFRYGGDGARIDWSATETWQVFVGGPAVFALTAVMCVAIGALVRTSGVAVTSVVGLLIVLPFAGLFGLDWLASITSYLPNGAGNSIVGAGAFGASAEDLGVVVGSVVLVLWVAALCVAASVAMGKRDA
jgi:ABC-2 type transport system permease protein